jgi:mannose-6-phosphate isomerase-like protein (cupin superfamily)
MKKTAVKFILLQLLLLLLLLACWSGDDEPAPTATPSLPATYTPVPSPSPFPTSTNAVATVHPTSGQGWQVFDLMAVSAEQISSGRPYHQFLDEPSMSMGVYVLASGAIDNQTPHNEDEVYIILEGRGLFQAGDDELPFESGNILFVRAGVRHQFRDITENLKTLVIFFHSPTDPNDPDWLYFTKEDFFAGKTNDGNVWNLFLDVATMQFGMYMLPQLLDGDQPLTHTFDEVNVVVNGRGTFRVGDDEINIVPGSIIFVEDGMSHSFQALNDDVAVLILFEKRN